MPGLLCEGHRRRSWAKGEIEKSYWKEATVYGSGKFRKRGNAIHTWHERRYEIRNDSLLVYYNATGDLRGYLQISHVDIQGGKNGHLDKSGFCDFGLEPENGVPMKIISMSEEPQRHLDVVFDLVEDAQKFCVLLNKGSNKNNIKQYVSSMKWTDDELLRDELVEDINGIRILHNADSQVEFPDDFHDTDSDNGTAESSFSAPTGALSDASSDISPAGGDDLTPRSLSLSVDTSTDDENCEHAVSPATELVSELPTPMHFVEIFQDRGNEAWYDSSPAMAKINYMVGCLECWVNFVLVLSVFSSSILFGLVDISKSSYTSIVLTQLLLTSISVYIQKARVKGRCAMAMHPSVRQVLSDIAANVAIVFSTMVILFTVKYVFTSII